MNQTNPFLSRRARPKPGEEEQFAKILSSWHTLQSYMPMLDEDTLVRIFYFEKNYKNRMPLLNRLKARHNRLRDMRERSEIFGVDYDLGNSD
jgi:hypothetical protein